MVEVVPVKGPSYQVTRDYALTLVESGRVSWDAAHKRVYENPIIPSLISCIGPRGPEVVKQIPVKRRR